MAKSQQNIQQRKKRQKQTVEVSLSARQRESVITRIIEQSNYRNRKILLPIGGVLLTWLKIKICHAVLCCSICMMTLFWTII